METIIEKLKKVRALAERGEAGEAQAAKLMLDRLLSKHGLTIEDITDDVKHSYLFKYTFANEKSVMLQCISRVTDDPNLTYSHRKDKRKEFWVDLTEWQYIESKDMIDFHLKQFRKEMKIKMNAFLSAYINKHSLFADSAEGGESKLTPEELAELLRAYQGMDNQETYTKKLEE